MLSPTTARQLITRSNEPSTIHHLARALGFPAPLSRLATTDVATLGLPNTVRAAYVARGDASLRLLSLRLADDAPAPATITTIARRLSATVPHLLWLVIARQPRARAITIAAWHSNGHDVRVAALHTTTDTIADSDVHTLCTLAATTDVRPDVLRHARWIDILGRDNLTHRFFRTVRSATHRLATSLPATIPHDDAARLALLCVCRLLFLAFLEGRGWLNGDYDFLANSFTHATRNGLDYHRSTLDPLLFGALNTRPTNRAPAARKLGRIPFLNGGLFTRTPLERHHRTARFTNEGVGTIFDEILTRYRFVTREESTSWTESAIDPEILGRVFESLMNPEDRRNGGVFFTPHAIVARMTDTAIGEALDTDLREIDSATLPATDRDRLLVRATRLRILDPACGSGAFLVHSLHRLATLRKSLGDTTPPDRIRTEVLTHSTFGVDINPTAVWLCQLRLWLAVVLDSSSLDPTTIRPLPNLDRQIRTGDSLAATTHTATSNQKTRELAILRTRYTRATGKRKSILARHLDRTERALATRGLESRMQRLDNERRDLLRTARSHDLFNHRRSPAPEIREQLAAIRRERHAIRDELRSIRNHGPLAFAFDVHFADVAREGFDVVIGNPPWIRPHHLRHTQRRDHRARFQSAANSAWIRGALLARAGVGFASQPDTAALFIERATQLLAPSGVLALLVPAKLWRSLSGGGIRQLLLEQTRIHTLEDHSSSAPAFTAVTYPSIIITTARTGHDLHRPATIHWGRHEPWHTNPDSLPLDSSPGAPWLLLPDRPRKAFDNLAHTRPALGETLANRPTLGVKCGLNEAFLVSTGTPTSSHTPCATVTRNGKTMPCEADLLRPVLRGESLSPWKPRPDNGERIIWTHDDHGKPLRKLPPHARDLLDPYRAALERRSDARRSRPWWTLFRIEGAARESPRVAWSDIGRTPRAVFLPPGSDSVPLNSCYVLRCHSSDDALAITAILNSTLATAWLAQLAEPARGSYRRFLAWTVALLPIPAPESWPRARAILAPIAAAATSSGIAPDCDDLLSHVLQAYRIDRPTIQPLLDWHYENSPC